MCDRKCLLSAFFIIMSEFQISFINHFITDYLPNTTLMTHITVSADCAKLLSACLRTSNNDMCKDRKGGRALQLAWKESAGFCHGEQNATIQKKKEC